MPGLARIRPASCRHRRCRSLGHAHQTYRPPHAMLTRLTGLLTPCSPDLPASSRARPAHLLHRPGLARALAPQVCHTLRTCSAAPKTPHPSARPLPHKCRRDSAAVDASHRGPMRIRGEGYTSSGWSFVMTNPASPADAWGYTMAILHAYSSIPSPCGTTHVNGGALRPTRM